MNLQILIQYLNDLFPLLKITDASFNGLQIEGKQEIKSLATAVTANLETIEAAVTLGVDALIVHHGLFWQRDLPLIQGVKKTKIASLLHSQISLLAYHLPLDLHTELGNNWKAAKDLGWKNLRPFGLYNGVPIGVKGDLDSIPRDSFQQSLENYYEHKAIAACGGSDWIKSASLISGGAYKSILEAVEERVDAFITGSFDEPVWYQAFEEKINFFAMGHSATERVGPRALAQHLQTCLSIPCHFIDIYNPF